MSQELATRYPLVLVPGMLGFVRLLLYPYWFGIVPALRRGGAQVFAVQVSPLHSSELRGEQLLAIIEDICGRTGAARVNLIGHSQGALSARYAAAKRPDRVASVTSVAGPNQGSNWPTTWNARPRETQPRADAQSRAAWHGGAVGLAGNRLAP